MNHNYTEFISLYNASWSINDDKHSKVEALAILLKQMYSSLAINQCCRLVRWANKMNFKLIPRYLSTFSKYPRDGSNSMLCLKRILNLCYLKRESFRNIELKWKHCTLYVENVIQQEQPSMGQLSIYKATILSFVKINIQLNIT